MTSLPKVRKDIRTYSLDELVQLFDSWGEKTFRAKQVYAWIWKKSITQFDQMSNIPLDLRKRLMEAFVIQSVQIKIKQQSADKTIKIGFELSDGLVVEGVIIPTEKRITACVSSQVGCSLSCRFCATGTLNRARNLDCGEIYDQVIWLNRQALQYLGKPLTHIVYMGMGEPLLNYKQVVKSIHLITSKEGLQMSPRRITVSTVGISKNIIRLADEGFKCNLALSLHAATNEKRETIMDINKSNPIEKVMQAMHYFYQKTGNKITFEYILFNMFNDGIDDARHLVSLYKKLPAFVNIIEYNQVETVQGLYKAKRDRRDRFVDYLKKNGVDVNVRKSRGKDIDAACGQLVNKH